MDDEGDGKERAAGPGLCCGSTTLSALWATFAFNTVFTLAQCFGAVLANSVALLSDTGTMFVDSLTYACNIGAEYLKVRGASERTAAAVDLSAAGLSTVALLAITAFTIDEALQRLLATGEGDKGGEVEEVNGPLMFVFTAVNLAIDVGMLGSILLRDRGGWSAVLSSSRRATVCEPPSEGGGNAGMGIGSSGSSGDLNVWSALAHVLTDTMRTVTEMTCSVIVMVSESTGSSRIDAIAALAVSAIIFGVALLVAYEAVAQWRACCARQRARQQQSTQMR